MPPGADAPTLPGDAADRVSRIELDGQTIGTVVRISEHGVCVAATHCLVDAGKFLEHASAFGGKLELIGSSPNYDIIFVKGRQRWRLQRQQPCAGVCGLHCSTLYGAPHVAGHCVVLRCV